MTLTVEIPNVTVTIRDKRTGEERNYRTSWPYNEEVLEFMWSEGNYACDCNRANFFADVAGETRPENVSCTDENYLVRVRWNGRLIYAEWVEVPQ